MDRNDKKTETDLNMKYNKLLKYTTVYTILFITLFLFCYQSFFLHNKTFIWHGDGYYQHYPVLIYIGRYFRDIFRSIFTGNLQIPMYDFKIGMGSDILSTLSYYGFGDIFLSLSMIVPPKYSEFLYDFLVMFRMYLSGLAFSSYCFYMGKKPRNVLIGSYIYIFCSYTLYAAVRHPFFINPMIYTPILAIGIDQILRKKKPYLFLIAAFFALLTGFYFYYMATIFLLVYALIRFFTLYQKERLKEFAAAFTRCLLAYLLSIMLAAFHLFPSVLGYFTSSRSSGVFDADSWFFFDLEKYTKMFLRFISGPLDWDYLGLSVIVLLAVVVLFTSRKKEWISLKIGFSIAALTAAVPLGSYVMNGFGYVSFRWTFLFSFLAAYIVVCVFDRLMNMSRFNRAACLGIIGLYGIICIFSFGGLTLYKITAMVLLVLTFSILSGVPFHFWRWDRHSLRKTYKKRYLMLSSIIFLNLILNANYLFSPAGGGYSTVFRDHNKVFSQIYGSKVFQSFLPEEADFYRIDSRLEWDRNEAMLIGYHSLSTYLSLINNWHSQFIQDMEVSPGAEYSYTTNGFDDRTFLNALASVRYKIPDTVSSFGYEKQEEVYKNQSFLPIGYTYDSYITTQQLEKSNPLQQQEIMLQGVILEEKAPGYNMTVPKTLLKKLPYEITLDGITLEEGKLIVSKADASIKIGFLSDGNSEVYVRFLGLVNDNNENLHVTVWNKDDISKYFLSVSTKHYTYFGRQNYMVNLGYQKEAQSTCKVVFDQPGVYSLEELSIYQQSMEDYKDHITARTEDILEEVQILANQVTGNITLKEKKILCFSIPYSTGWKAYVDGSETKIHRANGMYMAVFLEPGYHEIRLSYYTPGLKFGIIISAVGITVMAVMIGYSKKKKGL